MPNSNDKRPPNDHQDYQDYNDSATDNDLGSSDPAHCKISDTVNRSSPAQTAAYLADMLQELQTMAEKSGHSSLGEMLEFAHREAVWRSRTSSAGPAASDDREEMR